ncbi:hypothetical protein ZIOFF_002509 [Zingiber officinale]|uniref:Thymidine kinase n=1 Tax=Zingiber officinale TaxID=94328 RepID=A0A8J5IBN4_ZINOF|nr:hypothetical protein ZIOFF_002509 [Zingiber officinale]
MHWQLDVIGIDEAQFFVDLYDFCCNAADRDQKTVIVAGLDGDYLRRRFGSVLDIILLANSVTKLTARKGRKLGLQAKSMKFCMQKTDQYVKIVVVVGGGVSGDQVRGRKMGGGSVVRLRGSQVPTTSPPMTVMAAVSPVDLV